MAGLSLSGPGDGDVWLSEIGGGVTRPFPYSGAGDGPHCPAGSPLPVRTTITAYDATGRVGRPLLVTVSLTVGVPIKLRVSLSDGLTESIVSAPDGLVFGSATLFPVPKKAGVWRLTLRSEDALGCFDETGLVRTITVQ